jgi:hypothetical protein
MSESHFESEGPEVKSLEEIESRLGVFDQEYVALQQEWIANSDRIRSLWKAETAAQYEINNQTQVDEIEARQDAIERRHQELQTIMLGLMKEKEHLQGHRE